MAEIDDDISALRTVLRESDWAFESHQYSTEWQYTASCDRISRIVAHIDAQAAEIERLRDALLFVQTWANAYPLERFPEPHRFEWQQATALLSENGISIGSLSASNMRHVITGIKRAVDHGLTDNDPGAIGPQGASA